MKTILKILLGLTFITAFFPVSAQKFTLSGHVKDAGNGEMLIGVNVYVKNTAIGVISNAYGFYSLSLSPGKHNIILSFIGYKGIDTLIDVQSNVTLNFELAEAARQLKEVEVKAKRATDNITSTQMSVTSLSSKTLKQLPVAFGEVDALKSLSLLPGVKTSDEGSSAMSVRGGARDQNLILLDEATVYNASHLGNLLSVFNNDAIQNLEFYKGNLPAQYGGRLSSLIDIRMRDGNRKKFTGTGGIGTLSSRLTLEGPIVKDKASFIVSGRRTYVDMITKAFHAINDTIPQVPYYFYDLNMKANFSLNSKHKLYVSGYFGKDVFLFESRQKDFKNDLRWGNYTGTFRWNYIPSAKLFTNLTLLVSNYNYDFGNEFTFGKEKKKSKFNWEADLIDYSVKYDVGWYINDQNLFRMGLISTYHKFNPGKIAGFSDTIKYNFKNPRNNALEHAFYVSNEQKITPQFSLQYGIRYTLFQNIGKASVYKLNSDYETIDTLEYGKNKIYNTYHSIEPRIGLTYLLTKNSSVKLGYSRTSQFVHVASNSSTGSIIDLWIGSSPNIKPQYADLYSAGYFRNLFKNQVEASIEVYYKNMENQVEFREFATPQFNPRMDEDFRQGKGRSYGVELMMKKSEGRLTGWVSYTWSKSERKINGIQEKDWFLSPTDRRHDLTVVGMYNLSKRLSFSTNFTLKSGRPFTSPVLRYEYEGTVLPYYTKRNNDQMPLYHRLDVALTLKGKEKPGRKIHSEWVLSVFDVYNRSNPISIYFMSDEDNEFVTHAYRQSFLGLTPSITWNFTF